MKYAPIVNTNEKLELPNRVRITDTQGNIYEGEFIKCKKHIVTIKLDNGEVQRFDFS